MSEPLRTLRLPAVLERTGLSKALIYRLESQGKFPRRVKLTPRASAWPAHEVEAWLADRIRASRAGGAK
jgi:prophage regulatory protein